MQLGYVNRLGGIGAARLDATTWAELSRLGSIPGRTAISRVNDLASLSGAARVLGKAVPILVPRKSYDDPRAFDRAIAGHGVRRFVRTAFESDRHPAGEPIPEIELSVSDLVYVHEVEPGFRYRMGVNLEPQPADQLDSSRSQG